ncbi:hypothetical protein [Botrimarina mediterranea]|uniref:hypothetical protein n=1 Tax=Botrimarina mediterranea TaxID=2528022 RepID=UPI00118CEFA5|nr:hypothetical protein K2D_17010 [Planctomycetes bacterium K2D]
MANNGDVFSMCCCGPEGVFEFVAMHLGGPSYGYPGGTNDRALVGHSSRYTAAGEPDSYTDIGELYSLISDVTTTGDEFGFPNTAAENYWIRIGDFRFVRVDGLTGIETADATGDSDVVDIFNGIDRVINYVLFNSPNRDDRRATVEVGGTLMRYGSGSPFGSWNPNRIWDGSTKTTSDGSVASLDSLVCHTSSTASPLVLGVTKEDSGTKTGIAVGTASLSSKEFTTTDLLATYSVAPDFAAHENYDREWFIFFHANRAGDSYCVAFTEASSLLFDVPCLMFVSGEPIYAPQHEHTNDPVEIRDAVSDYYLALYPSGNVPADTPLPDESDYPANTGAWTTVSASNIRRALQSDLITGTPYTWFESVPQWCFCFEDNTDADAMICMLEFTAGFEDPTVANNVGVHMTYLIRERYEWWKGDTLVKHIYGPTRGTPSTAIGLLTISRPICSVGDFIYVDSYILGDTSQIVVPRAFKADGTVYFHAPGTSQKTGTAKPTIKNAAPAIVSANFPWNDPAEYDDLTSL